MHHLQQLLTLILPWYGNAQFKYYYSLIHVSPVILWNSIYGAMARTAFMSIRCSGCVSVFNHSTMSNILERATGCEHPGS